MICHITNLCQINVSHGMPVNRLMLMRIFITQSISHVSTTYLYSASEQLPCDKTSPYSLYYCCIFIQITEKRLKQHSASCNFITFLGMINLKTKEILSGITSLFPSACLWGPFVDNCTFAFIINPPLKSCLWQL